MLNSTTLRSRQTQLSNRRAVGAALVPTLVRLAECGDADLSSPARALVLAIYGDKLPQRTHNELMGMTHDELETLLDVMRMRDIDSATVPGYLTLYLGPQAHVPRHRVLMGERDNADGLTGFDAFARLRDSWAGTPRGEAAGRILRMDLFGRFVPAVRKRLMTGDGVFARATSDSVAEYPLPDDGVNFMLNH